MQGILDNVCEELGRGVVLQKGEFFGPAGGEGVLLVVLDEGWDSKVTSISLIASHISPFFA